MAPALLFMERACSCSVFMSDRLHLEPHSLWVESSISFAHTVFNQCSPRGCVTGVSYILHALGLHQECVPIMLREGKTLCSGLHSESTDCAEVSRFVCLLVP